MRPLSATECISPAIERTKLVLFSPFRPGRSWKLSATAYLCRLGTMYFPFPLIYLVFLPAARRVDIGAVIALWVGLLLTTALFTWIFHLCSRLQFAYFDIAVNHGEFVAPAWRKYRPQSLAWTGFKIAAGLAIALLCAIPIAACVEHFLPVFLALGSMKPGQPVSPQFAGAIAAFYGVYGVAMLGFGLVFLVFSLLADFIVPSLALENTGLTEAFRRMKELIRREPGQFAIYTLLKAALAIAGYTCAIILWEIVFLLVTVIAGGIIFLLGYLLHLAGVPTVLLIAVGVLLAIVWYAAVMWSMMFAIGPVFTFLDAYAFYFLGGRYPMLGELLERSTPAPRPFPAFPAHYPPQPAPPAP